MAIGSSINAGLNRPDYSGIMQGAQSSANSRMQGAQAMAQGYAALGQGIGQGIQQYQQKQAEKKKKEDAIAGVTNLLMASYNQAKPKGQKSLAERLNIGMDEGGGFDKGALSAAIEGAGGAENFYRFAMEDQQRLEQEQKAKEMAEAQSVATELARTGQTNRVISPEVMQLAQQMRPQIEMDLAEMSAGLGLKQAQIGSLNRSNMPEPKEGKPGTVMGMQQIQSLKNSGMDVTATPMPDGNFYVTSVSPFGPTPVTNINTPPSQTAYGATVGTAIGKDDAETYLDLQQAEKRISKQQDLISLIDKGDANLGVLSNIKTGFDKARNILFKDKQAGERVTDTEIVNALTGSGVFELLIPLGVGARGLDTPAEREFLREVLTGNITMTPEALRKLAEMSIEKDVSALNTFNKELEEGAWSHFFEDARKPERRFRVPQNTKLSPTDRLLKKYNVNLGQ